MSQTLSVSDVNMGEFVLSVTTRHTSDTTRAQLEELTYKTIKAWLWIVRDYLQKGVYVLPTDHSKWLGSVEQRYAIDIPHADPKIPFKFEETFGDARVTVWDTFRSQNRIGFHLNSDDIPQVAVDTWYAQQAALKRIAAEFNAPAQPKNPPPIAGQPAAHAPAVEGAIVATRAPNPKEIVYADGQFVSYNVNRIVMGTNNNSVTYALWGQLGQKYPLKTVYKTKNGSDENSPDYIAMKDLIVSLALSVDAGKIEAAGNWRMVCKAATVGDKQYMNIVSLISQ